MGGVWGRQITTAIPQSACTDGLEVVQSLSDGQDVQAIAFDIPEQTFP